MAGERYNEGFKVTAVKQVTENSHSIVDVANRLSITTKSLYHWRDKYGENAQAYQEKQSISEELRKLKAELKRVTEERVTHSVLSSLISTRLNKSLCCRCFYSLF